MDARTLRPYQELMIDHIMLHPKGHLFAAMGMGKTVSVLTAIDRMLLSGMIDGPVLILAPLRVARDVWPQEVDEWPHLSGLRVVPIVGTETERNAALYKKASVYTCNYENLVWLCERWGSHWPYQMVVCDEVSKIKSLRASLRTNKDGTTFVVGQGGTRAKALLKVMYHHKIARFVGLTGTPTANGLEDLWGIMFPVDYGKRLGRTFSAFQQRWFQREYNGFGYTALPHAQDQILEAIVDVCLPVCAEDYFSLDEPIVREIQVDLPPLAKKQYRELEKTLYTEILSTPIEAWNAGAKTAKLRQMASGAVYTGDASTPGPRAWVAVHDAKIQVLEEIIEESAGAPIVVAYHFQSELDRLLKHFPKGRHLDQKSQTLADFNAGKIPILFAHPMSAGHGLNLQRGSNILVYFSCDFSAEAHMQIAERIGPLRQHQAGLHRSVFHYFITAKGTIDEDVRENLQSKRSIQDSLLEGMGKRVRDAL